MKKVITADFEGVRRFEDISTNKYYGVLLDSTQAKGFITKTSFNSDCYALRCLSGLTQGNGWDNIGKDYNKIFSSFIKNIISLRHGVYEFNTPDELVAWLLVK